MDESLDNYIEEGAREKNIMSCIIPFIWKSIKCKLTADQELLGKRGEREGGEGRDREEARGIV